MASSDDVVVEVKDPSDPASGTSIAMLPVSSSEDSKATATSAVVPAPPPAPASRSLFSRLNPLNICFRAKTPEEIAAAEAKKRAREEEKKRKAEEKRRKREEESGDCGDIPEDQRGKMQWLRKTIRKWLPPPWNYLLAGSPGTAAVAFGGYWLYNYYFNSDDKKE